MYDTRYIGEERKSIRIKLIRHAESENNQVYRQARHLYKGGTEDFDFEGWTEYVEKNRKVCSNVMILL